MTRVAYFVSRFPEPTQSFIVRELDAVAAQGLDVELFTTFRANAPALHPASARWVPRVRDRSRREAAVAIVRWSLRRPLAVWGTLLSILWTYRRSRRRDLKAAVISWAVGVSRATQLAACGAEHVHAHFDWPSLTAWVATRLQPVPLTFTVHAGDLYKRPEAFAGRARCARAVVTISEYNRRLLAERVPEARGKVRVVRCGIDADAYAWRLPRPAGARPVVLVVARLEAYKGHDVLVEALGLPGEELAGSRLEVVGEGPCREALERRARELGLDGRVSWRGWCEEPVVQELLRRADVFVAPSRVTEDGTADGIPVALMEAMAVGVPVVATAVTGIPELVRDGETGLVVAPDDPRALRAAIAAVLADGGAAAERARAARALVEREFAVARAGADLARIFTAGGRPRFRGRPGGGQGATEAKLVPIATPSIQTERARWSPL